ncbi:MAG: hypothetical protein H6737_23495 [Alphaproteobacteria bacterium]|nr:hypothetical protein [Alphaproteobacteria bacterium]
MLALLLAACTSQPAAPKATPAPAPVEEPAPKRLLTESATVSLRSGTPTDVIEVEPRPWAEVAETEGLVRHPEKERFERYILVPFGEQQLAVALDEGKGWTASADLNADGKIRAGEFVDLEGDDRPTAVLRTVMKRGRPPVDVPIRIAISTWTEDDKKKTRHFAYRVEDTRLGELPNGFTVRARSHGGIFDHPETELMFEGEGGSATGKVSEGGVDVGGERWGFDLTADGNTLTITPR